MTLITMQPYEFTAQGSYADDFYCRVSWADDADNATNTSRPVITALQFKSKYWSPNAWVNGTIKADGVTIIEFSEFRGTHSVDITKNAGYASVVASGNNPNAPWYGSAIAHNNDGSKSITLEVNLYLRSTGGDLRINFYDSRTVNLAQIPRASSVGTADGNIEGVATISVTPKSTSYTHSLQYLFGNVSGWIDADGNPVPSEVKMTQQSIPFKIPKTFYSQIPNAQSGVGTIYCRTYSGNTQIGDTQSSKFRASTIPTLCSPAVTGSAVSIDPGSANATGNNKTIIRHMSTIQANLTANPKNGSSIVSTSVNGIPGNTATFSNAQNGEFVYSATDSRGYTTTVRETLRIVPYNKLTISLDSNRPKPTESMIVVTATGTYYNGSFGRMNNGLAVEYSVDGGPKKPMESIVPEDDHYTATVTLSLPYTENHEIKVFASDLFLKVESVQALSRGLPNFAIYPGWTEFYKPVKPVGGLFDIPIRIPNGLNTFDAEIEKYYKEMPWECIRLITFKDTSSQSGAINFGFLAKTNESYGFVIGWNYFGQKVYKLKQNGVWQGWAIGGM